MTEYELADSIASMIAVLLTWIGLSFTFLTAYLVTAYTVGRSLTGSQAWIINTFFCIFQLMTINGTYTSGSRYLEFAEEIRELNPDRIYSFSEAALFASPVVFILVTIFALKFMWDVRHPKAE